MILYNLYETYNIQGYHFEFHHCLQHLVGQNILPEKTQSFTFFKNLHCIVCCITDNRLINVIQNYTTREMLEFSFKSRKVVSSE